MVNVTFNIDMSEETFQCVFIASDFNSWEEFEIQESVGSIYSYTIQLEENKNFEYKFLLSNENGLKSWESICHPRSVNKPYCNRIVEVGELDINLPTIHFGRFD